MAGPRLISPQTDSHSTHPPQAYKLLERGPFPIRNDAMAAYKSIEAIGQGSSGIARKAIDGDGKPVVIKELKTILLPNESEERCKAVIDTFGKEALILSKIFHPNIPECIDSFAREVDGEIKFYIVTRYVEGTNLREKMKAGAFSEEQAKDLLKQLLETTRYLQSFDNPILHRDINPSNVILDNKGRYNLADFGIAAIQAHGTINGTECGTAGYAAPEQIVLGKASASSEVYSIGATVISMLTGKPPYDMGNDWQEDFISHADISPGFAAVLKRMVAVNKDERCQNSAEASQALEHSGKVIALAKSASASSNDSLMKDLDNLDKRNTKAKKAYEKELGRKAADILHLIRKMLDMRKRIQAPHTDYQHGEDRQYIELWNMSCRVHTKGEKDIVNIDPHPERVLSVCVSTLVAMPGIITLMVDHFQNRIFTSIGFLFIAVSLATFAVSYSIENAVNRFNNIRKIKRVLREFPGTPETVVKLAKKVRASIVEKNNDLDSNTKKLSDKGQAESSDSIERKTANASPSDNSGGAIIKSSKPKIRVTSITTQDGQKKIRVKREEKAEEASAEISSDGSKKSKGSA